MNLFERINKQLLVECEDGTVVYTQAWWNTIPDGWVAPQRTEEESECYWFAYRLVEQYAKRTGLTLNINSVSTKACYNWLEDSVTTPTREQFDCDADFFGTVFHEIVHSTGHQKRLDRSKPEDFLDRTYCEEELVAELGAMYLMAICCYNSGNNFEQSASYIKHYKANTNTTDEQLLEIAQKAMDAVDYILGE